MFYLTLYLAKLTNLLIKIFNIGYGYTWPGHIALKINPNILSSKHINFPLGVVLISGTNGKTTTSKIITHIFEENGIKVIHNKTGANLINGIVSEILLSMNVWGKHNASIGIFEVDENNLPLILKSISPKVLVLLNLTRDQLDRYGEVDIILEKWLDSLKFLDKQALLVVDGTQPYFNDVKNHFRGAIHYFDDNREYFSHTKLMGDFNAKNVNASVAVANFFSIQQDKLVNSLKSFDYAYGRGETIFYNDKEYKILLAKNPASFNNNMKMLADGQVEYDTLLILLNDNIPDGRDVSWIYDVDQLLLKKVCANKNIYVGGTRYLDMCIRLEYAGALVSEEHYLEDISKILINVKEDPNCRKILVLPNYSAMLNLRKILIGKAIL